MPDVTMPRLSDSMEEGTILKWLKAAGDEVAKGDELVEIETDKATMTYEADSDGTLEIVAEEGSTLSIGEVIARIGEGAGQSAGGGAEDESGQEAAAGDGDASGDGGGGAATKTEEAEEAEEAEEEGEAEEPSGEEESESESDDSESDDSESDDGEEAAATTEEAEQPTAESGGAGGDDGGGDRAAEAERAPAAEGNGGRPKASPVARRIAREHGIDLSTLEGTGPGGRIVKADVEAAASGGGAAEAEAEEAPAPEAREAEPAPAEEKPAAEEAPAEEKREPEREKAGAGDTGRGEVTVQEPSRIQQIIARRMAESKATIPHFTLSTDVDMEGAVELRDQLKALAEQQDTPVPSYNDMVVKACAIALHDFPLVNGAYRDGKFELYGRVNIGVAVAGEGTLIVPTIFDADRKGLGQIAKESRALAEKVRDGKISPPELSGATFSITNLGMYGVTTFTAVINPPQAAILAVGRMEPKPVVRDGEVVVRNGLNLTIACDHRILSGAPAAEFLARVKAILEQPIALAL
jgi:pyruvate dehydrogenase E2 component (dihydrolipoyllysine-residue acetyltransferase)